MIRGVRIIMCKILRGEIIIRALIIGPGSKKEFNNEKQI